MFSFYKQEKFTTGRKTLSYNIHPGSKNNFRNLKLKLVYFKFVLKLLNMYNCICVCIFVYRKTSKIA